MRDKVVISALWTLAGILASAVLMMIALAMYGVALQRAEPVVQSPPTTETACGYEPQPLYHCYAGEGVEDMLDELTAAIPFIPISDSDRYIVECVVAGEAGGHSYELMKAVAQCMAISMDMRDMTAEECRASHRYSGYNPDLEHDDPAAWAMVQSAVSEIFDDGNFVTYSPIEYFYNPSYGGGRFHEKMNYVMTIDGVKFFSDVEVG